MKFTFNAKKMELTEDVKDYAIKKIGKLDRFFEQDSVATVKFAAERGRSTVEVTLQCDKLFVRAEETTGDVFASIDGVVERIERQIRKNKTRLEKRLRAGAFERTVPDLPVVEETEEDFALVRTKRFEVKPMTVDEAILQMNLLNHQFFFFRNIESDGRHAVVYHRNDGGYGLIESD